MFIYVQHFFLPSGTAQQDYGLRFKVRVVLCYLKMLIYRSLFLTVIKFHCTCSRIYLLQLVTVIYIYSDI